MSEIKLRDYQFDAYKQMIFEDKGRCLIPTGGGKTILENIIIAYKTQNDESQNISMIVTPRIMLNQQHAKETAKVLKKGNIIYSPTSKKLLILKKDTRIIVFHSGEHSPVLSRDRNWKENATTDINDVKKQIEKANNMGQNVVIISTYHSCHKLNNIDFNTIIADESHFITQKEFFKSFNTLKADNKFFFTATEVHSYTEDGRGNNNEEVYGKELFSIKPIKLIKKGYITDIKIHISKFDTEDRKATFVDEVIKVAKRNFELSSKMPYHKVLFATPGTEYINRVADNWKEISDALDCDVYTIKSSDGKWAYINGEAFTRVEFMNKLSNSKKESLIFHYNILTEGIDIGDITGVVINRKLEKKQLIQTIGRSTRIYKPNTSLKPYAIISITGNNNDKEMIDYAMDIFDELHTSGFEMNEKKFFIDDVIEHEKDKDNLDDAYGLSKNNSQSKLEDAIRDFLYSNGFYTSLDNIIDEDGNLDLDSDEGKRFFKEYM